MNTIFVPTNNPEDWKPFLAEPEKHWRTGYSAKALAYSWEEATGFPESVKKVFGKSGIVLFKNVELLLAFPEYQVPLPGGSRPSQNDIFVLAKGNNQLISITVEGKVSEPFGETVGKWKQNASGGKHVRLNCLLRKLGLEEHIPIDKIPYQLLHRTASAMIEAKSFKAKNALMLVHSFSQSHECFENYSRFLRLFGLEAKPDSLLFAKTIKEINLYLCWVKGDPKYLAERAARMSIRINGPFISRKIAVDWPEYGLSKKKHEDWLQRLETSLQHNEKFSHWLKDALQQGKKIKLEAWIYGIPRRIKLLDIHDATAQIVDEVTECLFPKEKGKPTPQVEDRHFWRVEGEKFVRDKEKVQVEIEELRNE